MGRSDWGREPTAREHEIREILAAGERDGLNVREMADRAGMPPGTLSWWRGDLRRRERLRRTPTAARAAAVAPAASRSPAAAFVEVVVPQSGADGGSPSAGAAPAARASASFEIEIRGGRRVMVPVAFGLARLVRELEGC